MWSQSKTPEPRLSDTIEEEHKETEHVPCRKRTGDGDFCLLKAPREGRREEEENKKIKRGGWLSGRETNIESEKTWRGYLKITPRRKKGKEKREDKGVFPTAARFFLTLNPHC